MKHEFVSNYSEYDNTDLPSKETGYELKTHQLP